MCHDALLIPTCHPEKAFDSSTYKEEINIYVLHSLRTYLKRPRTLRTFIEIKYSVKVFTVRLQTFDIIFSSHKIPHLFINVLLALSTDRKKLLIKIHELRIFMNI